MSHVAFACLVWNLPEEVCVCLTPFLIQNAPFVYKPMNEVLQWCKTAI